MSKITRILLLLFVTGAVFSSPLLMTQVSAQSSGDSDREDDEPKNILGIPNFKLGKKPVFVVTLASLNRAKESLSYVFEAAGYPETMDEIQDRLDDNAGGLNGIDWERPGGAMAYLNSVFPPAFEFVVYVPITNVEDFQRTMELGSVVMVEVPNEEGRYELIGPSQTSQVRIENDYAFIQLPFFEPDSAFDRDLPDALAMAGPKAKQFDLSITMDVEAVPKATRDLLLNLVNSTMSANMQQRDDEPESLYEIRRSWMEGDIAAFKLLLDELKSMTIGLDIIPEERAANIDLIVDAPEGTKLFEEMFQSTSKPTYFAPILNEDAPISISMSSVISDRDRERYVGVFEGLKGELARQIDINDLGPVPDESSPVFDGLSALQETFQEGHLDVFGQCFSDSNDKLVVVAALRLQRGDAISAGLFDLLNRVQDQDDIGEMQLGYGEHAGLNFHRIVFKGSDPAREEVFGREASLIFGVGNRTAWFCVGGEDGFDTLKGVIDQLTAAYENPQERQVPASLRVIVNVNQLVQLQQRAEGASRSAREEAAATEAEFKDVAESLKAPEGQAAQRIQRREAVRRRRARGGEVFMEQMAMGDDRIEIDFQPTDNGGRTRIHFQEAFIRFVGEMVASNFQSE